MDTSGKKRKFNHIWKVFPSLAVCILMFYKSTVLKQCFLALEKNNILIWIKPWWFILGKMYCTVFFCYFMSVVINLFELKSHFLVAEPMKDKTLSELCSMCPRELYNKIASVTFKILKKKKKPSQIWLQVVDEAIQSRRGQMSRAIASTAFVIELRFAENATCQRHENTNRFI